MTLPDSLLAYDKETDLFDKAIEDGLGIRIRVKSTDEAMTLRARLHQARVLDRKQNKRLYEAGHRMHGHSIYDPFICQIRADGDKTYLYITKVSVSEDRVEGLSGVEDDQGAPVRLSVEPTEEPPEVPPDFKRRL